MIKAKKISKSYGSESVISDITFTLERGQKVALVGHNGTGKTTLLKILAGIEKPDGGMLEMQSEICVGYLPQDTSLNGDETIAAYLSRVSGIEVLQNEMNELVNRLDNADSVKHYGMLQAKFEHLDGYSFSRRMELMLAGLGLDGLKDWRFSNLSSGQKIKVFLAGILLSGVDLLLLDEPTNNLDLPALIWLEDFLKKTAATCIVVSHDRRFLDKVVRKIFEIDWNKRTLSITNGTYSDYLEASQKKLKSAQEEYRLQQEEIDRLTDLAKQKKTDAMRGARWKGSDNDKFLRGFKSDRAAKSGKTARAIEKRIEHMGKIERPMERPTFEINLEVTKEHGTQHISLRDLVAGYKDGFTIGPITLEIQYGERIGIIGPNGSGKSTLLRTITGQLEPVSGRVLVGSGVEIGNMTQEHETLPREQSLFDFLKGKTDLRDQDIYETLTRFGFAQRQVNDPISSLSPGGRARLTFALFSSISVNTLILDEPTNHLDIEALEGLEKVIQTYSGTIILVSHDRFFLETSRLDTTYMLSDGMLSKILDYKSYIRSAEEKATHLLKLI
jgi:ATPase subunit of ABC transporter with duplicated ATPase domains